jgi:hypothetical protein
MFLISLFWVGAAVMSQQAHSAPQPEKREQAVSWFREGEFQKALPVFSKLAYDFPYDYMLKYYLGASMVETGVYGLEAEKNLVLAMPSDVPAKVYYYLGVIYHARNNWNGAQRYYNRFRNHADSTEVIHLDITRLTELCYQEVNPFAANGQKVAVNSKGRDVATAKPADAAVAKPSDAAVTKPDDAVVAKPADPATAKPSDPATAKPGNAAAAKPGDPVAAASGTETPLDTVAVPVGGTTDTIAPGKEPQLPTAAGLEAGAKTNTIASEKIPAAVAGLAEVSPDSTIQELPSVGEPAAESEKRAVEPPKFISFQVNEKVTYLAEWMFQIPEALQAFRAAEASRARLDSLLGSANDLRKSYHATTHPGKRDSLARMISRVERETILLKGESDTHYRKAAALEQEWWKDAGFAEYERFAGISDSLQKIKTPPLPVIPEPDPAFFLEAAGAVSTTTATEEEPQEEQPDPDQIVYRIQLGAYPKAVPASRKALFDKISKIRVIDTYVNDQGATVYTTGLLTDYNDALKLMQQVRLEGVKDAFVIALQNGKRVSLPKQ